MYGDMFRLRLQPSSGQLVVQIRYKYCAYDMGSHKVYMCSTSEIKTLYESVSYVHTFTAVFNEYPMLLLTCLFL